MTKEIKPMSAEDPPMVADVDMFEGLKEKLQEKGITQLTSVQAGTFEAIIEGRDIIARSRTGTGKTLAFGLPIVERLRKMAEDNPESGIGRQRGRGPQAIILAPTRELAKQVAAEIDNIGSVCRLKTDCFYGGVSYTIQENALNRGIDILVGTPGRVIDHLEKGKLDLSGATFAVLDEADEMLSMGFAEDIERVLDYLPPKGERQTILFSATVPGWVKSIARQHQQKPFIYDAIGSETNKTATTVRHCAIRVPDGESRGAFLDDIITTYGGAMSQSRCLVFTQTKKEADELVTSGVIQGGAAVLHGDVSQRQREITLSHFRDGRFPVLVATDVAARGLDITGVDMVIQYSVPQDIDSYIHRAGRTGRAGRSGIAILMHTDRELEQLRRLEKVCGIKLERSGPPSASKVLQACASQASECLKEVEENVISYFVGKATELIETEDPKLVLAAALALVARRPKFEERSMLTGLTDYKTMIVSTKFALMPPDVLRIIRKISSVSGCSTKAGKILICEDDSSAVFDYPVDDIELLLEGAAGLKGITISSVDELPKLRIETRFTRGSTGANRGGAVRGGYRMRDRDEGRGNRRRTSTDRHRASKGNHRDKGRPGRSSYGGSVSEFGSYRSDTPDDDDDFF
eukprot:Plantae.Rhodophyta-Purpureofilum_apyrenoidigerum.ctg7938.p1 GENE.Plantae.Rhodophyta-Purpureofilum_apyrenoidigerum.ctg7938~~Plantae.Rhodophyta-Purpureofilum_apyrenoidigerum.ctg7938.p1  ORF type:complete len:670 (+),score=128.60 Plantae.Rhodophyta-Purpureofilum_apyrenoidigerum.ctg7938:111-2012(+)